MKERRAPPLLRLRRLLAYRDHDPSCEALVALRGSVEVRAASIGGAVRHDCAPKGHWSHCCICDGRIHLDGCTSRRTVKDCSPDRHKMLFDAGQVRGINDDSFLTWSPAHPSGMHRGEMSDVEFEVYRFGGNT